MMESLRNAAGTWVAKLLLLMLVASFAVWGISGSITGGVGNAVITAGKSEVTMTEYRLAYDRQLNVLSQQFNTRLTREQAQAFGIDNQVMAQVVAGAVLDEQARLLDLGLSEDQIAKLTAEDPAFRGTGGRFDQLVFDAVLRNAGMRPVDYIENRQKVAKRQQVVEAVSDGLSAPQALLKAAALYAGETRTLSFFTIAPPALSTIAQPGEAALASYFDTNKGEYRAPEYRAITYVKLEASDIAEADAITDEQARADYDKRKDRYTTPETRAIEQIVFKTKEEAEVARAQILAGDTFEAVVQRSGKTLADAKLGDLTKDRVSDPAVGEAAFTLSVGEISKVVDGAFGPVLVRVTAIAPETTKTYEDVAATIKSELALNEANRLLFDVHDAIEDELGGGATLGEAAAKHKLVPVTIAAIDRQGVLPDGTVKADLPASARLLAGAFETTENIENLPISIGSNGFVWYNVDSITPSRDRTLDEVRATVVTDWQKQEQARQVQETAEAARKKIADGSDLATVASELGAEVTIKRGLKRGGTDTDFSTAATAAVFDGPKGSVGTSLGAADGTQLVFRVDESIEPVGVGAESLSAEDRDRYAQSLSNDLLDQYVTRLQGEFDVKLNEAALRQAQSF
jgi:peptidyl-prolyl cis-trans isomerase D